MEGIAKALSADANCVNVMKPNTGVQPLMNQPRPVSNGASRRDVLKFAAGAVAATAFAGSFARAFEHGDEAFGGLPIGLQSYTLRKMSLDNALAAMQNDLKIHEVELFPNHIAGLSPAQVVEKLKAHDVRCVSFGVIPFGKKDDANRKHFELAKALGCKNLSCDPENDAKCFESVGKLCEEYKITAAIQPHGPGSRWVKIDQIFAAIKDVNPMIGLNNETGWLIAAGEDPVRACDVFKGRMYAMHLKDFKKGENGKLEDVPAGDGQLDVDALIKKLLEMKFAGAFSVEYEGSDPVPAVQKSLERIKAAVKKAKGA
jgi:inosose dehydratase